MKKYINVLLFLFVGFVWHNAYADNKGEELTPLEARFYYASFVVDGEVISVRSSPPYLKTSNSYYLFKIQFLVKKVLKGNEQVLGKVLTFDAHLASKAIHDFVPHTLLTLAFTQIDSYGRAVPLDYTLEKSIIIKSNIRKEILENKINYSKVKVPSLTNLFTLPESMIYHSPLIVWGYQKKEYRLKANKKWYAFYSDNPPDGYSLKEFYVERVVRGDKNIEGKIINLVEPFYESKIKTSSRSAFFVTSGYWFLLGLRDISYINTQSDPYYPGPDGYNVHKTQWFAFFENDEPLIRLYLEEAKSSSFTVPAKPNPFYPK